MPTNKLKKIRLDRESNETSCGLILAIRESSAVTPLGIVSRTVYKRENKRLGRIGEV